MKTLRIGAVALGIFAIFLAQPSQAHRIWLLPSTFTLSGNEQWITVDGAISNDLFYPNHVPLRLERVAVTAPDGSLVEIQNAATGKFRSVFDVHLTQQGTYRIAQAGNTFFARWTEDGEPQRRRGTLDELLAAGLDEKEGVQFAVSNRSVATYVTLGAPTTSVFETTGSGLEFVPASHPNDLFAGDTAAFRIVHNGNPAEGLEVTVVQGADRYRNRAGDTMYTADADGRISVTFDEPGSYWLEASVEGETEVEGRKMAEYLALVVTFEVLPE